MKKLLKTVVSAAVGGVVGGAVTSHVMNKSISEREAKIDKFKGYYNLLNEWLVLKQRGESLTKYFEENNVKSIAIYGMGELGNRLYEELKNSHVEVSYAIDKNADDSFSELQVIYPSDEFSAVDAIIVTSIFDFDEIEEELADKTNIKIVSLEDVVYMI